VAMRRDKELLADASGLVEAAAGQLIIFLSAVSDEFRAYRARLRDDLMRAAEVGSVIQEDFTVLGEGTLDGLDARIRNCAAVVHLIGDMSGAYPPPKAVQRLLDRYLDLPNQLGLCREELLASGDVISYTQWEAYLAIYHNIKLYIAQAGRDAAREGTTYRRDDKQLASQLAHRNRLRHMLDRWHELQFERPDDLAAKLLPALAREHRAAFTGASIWSLGARQFEDYYLKGRTLDGRTVPAAFGGRQHEFDHLDRWLFDPTRDPRLLISSPAGRGKSALLAKWLQTVEASGRTRGEAWRIVFVPISNRFQTNRSTTYLELLTRQLAHVTGEQLIPPTIDREPFYRNTASRLIAGLADSGTRTLLVFDGLDEALCEEHLANLLPAILPSTLRVLASARWLVGDRDGSDWLRRLGWIGNNRTAGHDLIVEPLNVSAIADVLVRMGAPIVATNWALVTKLSELTEGEPLLLRFYAEDLWLKSSEEGPVTLAALDGMQPGIGPYFKAWLQDQGGLLNEQPSGATHSSTQIDPRTIHPALAVLGYAKGPLTGNELIAICGAGFPKLPWWSVAKPHVAPFRRFVIGNGDDYPFVFSHPKVAEYIRAEECAGLADQAAVAFFAWGQDHISKLNSGKLPVEKASAYALDYHADHLAMVCNTAVIEDYMAMVEDCWRRAKELHDGGPAGFAADVRAAWDACRRDGPVAHHGAQWRCALTLSSIASSGKNVPRELIVAAVRYNLLAIRQAEHLAQLKEANEAAETLTKIALAISPNSPDLTRIALRALALSASSFHAHHDAKPLIDTTEALLPRANNFAQGVRIILTQAALMHATTISDDHCYPKALALAAVAPHLSNSARVAICGQTYNLSKAIDRKEHRAEVLTSLIPLATGHLRSVVQAEAEAEAMAIDDPEIRARALAILGRHVSQNSRDYVVNCALEALKSSEYAEGILEALGHLSPILTNHLIPIAHELVDRLDDQFDKSRGFKLIALAPNTTPQERAHLLEIALESASSIDNDYGRGLALSGLAQHFEPQKRAQIQKSAITAAKGSTYEIEHAEVVVALAPHLDPLVKVEATTDALKAVMDELRSPLCQTAVADLSPFLDPHQRAESLGSALKAAKSIDDKASELLAITAVASCLGGPMGNSLLDRVLEGASGIRKSVERVQVYASLATHMYDEGKSSALCNALQSCRVIRHGDDRSSAIAELAPLLIDDQMDAAINAAAEIDDEEHRANALVSLVPRLDLGQLHRVLTIAESIRYDDEYRARVQAAAAPGYAAANDVDRALSICERLGYPYYRAKALAQIGPYMRSAHMVRALSIAEGIDLKGSRAAAFTSLLPYLQPVQRSQALQEAMEAASKISRVGERAIAIARLIPYADPGATADLVTNTLDALKTIHASQAIELFNKLRPNLSCDKRRQALTAVIESINSMGGGPSLFVTLAAHLDQAEARVVRNAAISAIKQNDSRQYGIWPLIDLCKDTIDQQRETVLAALINLASELPRSEALTAITKSIRAIYAVGGHEAILGLHRSIVDVVQWYP
jgi:hypothetical protein